MKLQEQLFHNTTYLRIKNPLPPYPCYHEGLYLEEYFCNYFIKNCLEMKLSRYYVPIFWSNIYQKNWIHGYRNPMVQCYLNTLPKNEKYFTITTHDDAPAENISFLNMDVYSAGGNYPDGIPIPLICSKIPSSVLYTSKKSIFCSLIASNTHDVRTKVIEYCKKHKEFYIACKDVWQYTINKSEFDHFVDITKKSIFTLCPRGYGKQSFRFYECIQLGSIPVYIYDNEPYLPFSNDINYDEFAVILNIADIENLKDILESKTNSEIESMLQRGKEIYEDFFTLDKVTKKIISLLEK